MLLKSVVFCNLVVATTKLGVGEKVTKFSKKHFEAIAKLMKTTTAQSKDETIQALVKLFKEDNPRFSAQRFLKACGTLLEPETETLRLAKVAYAKLGVA